MIEAVKKKLSEILDKRVIISEKKLSEMRISEFEDKYQIKVPKQYREFLLNYGEAYINTGYQFPMIEKSIVTPQSGFETIDFLYSVSFIENAEQYIEENGIKMLPIGQASGDIVCIGVQEDKTGKIFYMYHESEDLDYYLISESFVEFILSFEKQEEKVINLDEVEIELDEELLND